MPTLLIRDIPDDLSAWIDDESHARRTSKKDFVLSLLRNAWRGSDEELPLFDQAEARRPEVIKGVPFTFIDLFAGIGGMRIGLERVGGRCLFTSEWDRYAQKTYKSWFGETPVGDIRPIRPADIPDHDVLAAGFPCQPFSIAGVSKKKSLGRDHSFKDATQGTLFFQLATIIEIKRPPVILLENVKNLRSHDQGNTWAVIRSTLEDLDYAIFDHVIDAAASVPQHRERVFIVGFDRRVVVLGRFSRRRTRQRKEKQHSGTAKAQPSPLQGEGRIGESRLHGLRVGSSRWATAPRHPWLQTYAPLGPAGYNSCDGT